MLWEKRNDSTGTVKPFNMHFTLAKFFFVILVVAAILNGSEFWLKRVGFIEPQMYQTYQDFLGTDPDYLRTPAENEQLRIMISQLYASEGNEVFLKLAKDVWLLLFVVISVVLAVRFQTGLFSYPPWSLSLFLLLVALSAIYSAWHFEPLMALAGLRFFSFFAVTLCASWVADRKGLSSLALALMVLMTFQLLLAPIELVYGLRMFGAKFFGSDFGDRIVGTMLQPSSLGITSVLSLVLYLSFSNERKWFMPSVLITIVLVFLSASAMAILLLCFVAIYEVYQRTSNRYRVFARVAALLGIASVVVFLPEVSGRWNIMDSLWGRLLPIEQYIEQADFPTLIFGQGLGVGTNTAANLLMNWQVNHAPGYAATTIFIADATPLALLAQIGVIGLLLFYFLLGRAAICDAQARLFHILVAIGSLTTNLTELFPVNIVLGILLARSLFRLRNESIVQVAG